MPMKTVEDERYAKPVFICDHCGKVITEAKSGNYQWLSEGSEP